jgi:LCP family protein required for cell wall assembly
MSTTPGMDTRAARRSARRRRRWVKPLVITMTSVLVLLAGAIGGYLAWINHAVDANVKRESLLPTATIPGVVAPTRTETAKDSLNLLLLGSDSRGQDQGRSDVIVLAHISDDRSRVDLIHFPRDLWVDIPGRGKNKINAAYAYGGAPLLVQTLQTLIKVPVDHAAMVDFEGFKAMTDAVGGVDVQVAESSPGYPKGLMHMNGDQGLVFVRDRHDLSQGDISRGQRQQAFIKAVLLKGLSKDVLLNPVRLASFIDAATKNMTVDQDFDLGTIRSLGLSMRNIRSGDVHFWEAPWTGVGTSSGGASIVNMSVEQMNTLSAALMNDSMSTYVDNVSPKHGFGG